MTTKEKAEELYCKYDSLFKAPFKKHQQIKECALIAVDEIIMYVLPRYQDFGFGVYWEEVKNEINKL
jgi:hypothetical protein